MGIFDFLKKKNSEPADETTHQEEEQATKAEPEQRVELLSVYEQIMAAIDDDGLLPSEFELASQNTDDQLQYAPGALDGIRIYHMPDENMSEQANEVFELLLEISKSKKGSYIYIVQLGEYLNKYSVLSLIDDLMKLLYQNRAKMSSEIVFGIALEFMTQQTNIELVKLGIALCSLINLEDKQNYREIILTLGKYSEFTLYALVAAGGWKDRNDLAFQYAKEVSGWGKIHALERLNPENDLIRDWILCYGCDNGALSIYSGLTCAQKGQMKQALQQDILPKEKIHGICDIINACLAEGPVAGISQYQDAPKALERFAVHVKRGRSDLKIVATVLNIYKWLVAANITGQLKDRYWNLIENNSWYDLVEQALFSEDVIQITTACSVADQMNYDIYARLLELVEMDPIKYSAVNSFLCKNASYAKQVFKIYELKIPLAQIVSGEGDSQHYHKSLTDILCELKNYPNCGEELIKTGIQSKAVQNRQAALDAVENWMNHAKFDIKQDESLKAIIETAAAQEPETRLKARMKQLLGL